MSIADEARAEAGRRFALDWTDGHIIGLLRRTYMDGYLDGASRKPEAAPSDTDREAVIEAVAQVMFEPPSLGQDDPEYTWAQMVLEDPSRADMYRQDAAAALEAAARTSQPVQVEVTDDMVAWLRDAISDPTGTYPTIEQARIILSAALGGGE